MNKIFCRLTEEKFPEASGLFLLKLLILAAGLWGIGVTLWSLPQPLGRGDEAWYLVLIRGQHFAFGSAFPLYLNFCKNWSILSLRVLSFLLFLLPGCFAGWAFSQFFFSGPRLRSFCFWMCFLGGSFYFIARTQDVLTPDYAQFAYLWGVLMIGCLAVSWSRFCMGWRRNIWLLLSGFFASHLVFIMPPCLLAAFLVFLAVAFSDKKDAWKWCCGFLAGVLVFFLFICPYQKFCGQILAMTASSDTHDAGLLWTCIYQYAKLFAYQVFPLAFMLFFIRYVRKRCHTLALKILYIVFWGLAFFLILKNSLPYSDSTTNGTVLFIPVCGLSMTVLLTQFDSEKPLIFTKRNMMLMLCSLMPFLLSLGSLTSVTIRGQKFLVFYFLPALAFVLENRAEWEFSFFMDLILAAGLLCAVMQRNATLWASGVRYRDCTETLSDWGINLKTTPAEKKALLQLQQILKTAKYSTGGSCCSWQFPVLFQKKPLSLQCGLDPAKLVPALKNQKIRKEEIAFMEDHTHSFSAVEGELKTYFGASSAVRIPVEESCYTVLRFR